MRLLLPIATALYTALAIGAFAPLEANGAAVQCPLNIQSRETSTLQKPPIEKKKKENDDSNNSEDEDEDTDGIDDDNIGSGSGSTNGNDTETDNGDGGSSGTNGSEAPSPEPDSGAASGDNNGTGNGDSNSNGDGNTPSRTPNPTPTTTPAPGGGGSGVEPNDDDTDGSGTSGTRRRLALRFLQDTDGSGDESPVPDTIDAGSAEGSTTDEDNVDDENKSNDTDVVICDEAFYQQWEAKNLLCGGVGIDVAQAVQASSCVIYSGSIPSVKGSTCVSMCSFPACTSDVWVYGSSNGIGSAVYKGMGIDAFIPENLKSRLAGRSRGGVNVLNNSPMSNSRQCPYSSEDSFASCSCSALIVDEEDMTPDEKKEQRRQDTSRGVISEDETTTAGSIVAPTSTSVAGVTVFVSGVAAVASTVAATGNAATASMAAAGGAAVVTIEICQFSVMINQMKLESKSAALALFGKQMAPSTFTFLPFGKMDNETEGSIDDGQTRRRLEVNDEPTSGVATYSRTLGIREDMLFLVTLAGVVVVMAGIVGLFGIAYLASGMFMSKEDFMAKFFDKMIGLQILVAVLSQYTIGVTATYQIYHSVVILDNPTDPKCISAACALIFLAFGIMLYGFVVVKHHEDDIRDVGTFQHLQKPVCQRYGPLYDEYKFKSRYFFAAKMMLALVSGMATGYVGFESTTQVSIVLATHVIFFFYLEVKSPHHSKFVQTTTSFVTIMKISTLALTFFLISASQADGFPSELQNAISLAIVGLNLFVLFLLMIRALYAFWKKYKLQRDGQYDQDELAAAQQQYYGDETPPRKGQIAQPTPYMRGNTADFTTTGDDIRLRSGTHMQQDQRGSMTEESPPSYDPQNKSAVNHYSRESNPRSHHRRNDVVEL